MTLLPPVTRLVRLTVVAVGLGMLPAGQLAIAQPSRVRATAAVDDGAWHSLEVTGGRVALDALGVSPTRERAATLIELVRRLHFSARPPGELEAAVIDLSAAVADLAGLQNAIAVGSSPGKPLTLKLAADRRSRKHLQEALAAAGLELKESKKQYRVDNDGGDAAAALRARLSLVGVNVEDLRRRIGDGAGLTIQVPTLSLPLPLSPQTWAKVIFGRDIPPRRLFVEILNDPAARLLYHGLFGLDEETRRWIGAQPELLRRLYRDEEAIRSFSLFGPALKVAGGRIVVPGGKAAEQRWSAALDVDVSKPDRFVRRLFDQDAGRTAGLYFTVAAVDQPRQAFLLSTADTIKDGNDRFRRLASSFANCYPRNAALYPFTLRSHDAALLLLEVGINEKGVPAGPLWRRFWSRVLNGDGLPDNPANEVRDLNEEGTIDAAWMVDTLCGAPTTDRGSIFVTLLAGHRIFSGASDAGLADALVALRARRWFPAVVMALEQAGVRSGRTYATVARHAERLARVEDPVRAVTALQQFQGAMALIINALAVDTLTVPQGERLLESLAAVPFEDERYNGRLADWLQREWLPAVRSPSSGAESSPELIVANALAGRAPDPIRHIQWEGQSYVLDFASTERQRLLDVRKRQGELALDTVLDLARISNALRQRELTMPQLEDLRTDLRALAPRVRLANPADEFGDDGPNIQGKLTDAIRDLANIDSARELKRAPEAGGDLTSTIDFLAGHVLASWAYAPHVGDADGPALVGGDGSLRHIFGLRSLGGDKLSQRWEVAPPGGEGGAISGSLLGLDVALARWSLRRLSTDTVPPAPTIGSNDFNSFMLTASLSNPRRLKDDDLARIATASQAGADAIAAARSDKARLDAAAQEAAMSPWTRQALSWMITEESDRLTEQFSVVERARLGGLRSQEFSAWGTANLLSGCLCLRMPQTRIPETIIGRAADGLLGGHSADLMIRIATVLAELKLPAALASPVLAYAMREFLDNVKPVHAADFDAFARQARALDRRSIEDFIGAIAAVGPLRSADPKQ